MSSTPRHRERSDPTIPDIVYRVWSTGAEDQHGPYDITSKSESIDDWVTDDYAKRIASGAVINNPCDYTKSQMSQLGYPGVTFSTFSNGSYYTDTGPVTEYRASQSGIGHMSAVKSDFSDYESRAKLLALRNVDKTPYAFGEDIGELKETLELIRHPFSTIASSAKRFRSLVKARKKKFRWSHAKAVASVWLEYRFAWSPLVRSAYSAVDAYMSTKKTPPVRRSSDQTLDFQGQESDTVQNGSVFDRTVTQSYSGHASILYEVHNPLYDWKWRLGLRAKDIPLTAWQLARLSFMVDRVYDISSFIGGVTNLIDPNVKILAGSYTTRNEVETTLKLVDYDNPSSVSYTISGNTNVRKTFRYHRVVWAPSFADTIPELSLRNLVNDATKIADLTSIFIGALKV